MNSPKKILLVEGQDDMHVVLNLRDRHLPKVEFKIEAKGGIDELLKAIKPEIKVAGRLAVGVLADANDNSINRWRAVSGRLSDAGISAPASPPHGGALIEGVPRVGVWLMPDNRSPGALEDFVKRMVPSDDPVWSLAKKYIGDIHESERKFSPAKRSSAELRAWLATRATPGPMGTAIKIGDLKTDGELCIAFLNWIEKLFE